MPKKRARTEAGARRRITFTKDGYLRVPREVYDNFWKNERAGKAVTIMGSGGDKKLNMGCGGKQPFRRPIERRKRIPTGLFFDSEGRLMIPEEVFDRRWTSEKETGKTIIVTGGPRGGGDKKYNPGCG